MIIEDGRLAWCRRRRLLEIRWLTVRWEVIVFWVRWPTACAIGCLGVHASMANRTWSVWCLLRCSVVIGMRISNVVVVEVLVAIASFVPAPHTHVTTDSDTTALLGNRSTEWCAL